VTQAGGSSQPHLQLGIIARWLLLVWFFVGCGLVSVVQWGYLALRDLDHTCTLDAFLRQEHNWNESWTPYPAPAQATTESTVPTCPPWQCLVWFAGVMYFRTGVAGFDGCVASDFPGMVVCDLVLVAFFE
jgi:hypothetical protein